MATPGGESDEQILAIYRETIGPLYGYVSRGCHGDRALAEDVTQEAWLRAVREWRRKGLPDQPAAWLRTVARNLLVTYYRSRRHEVPEALLSTEPEDSGDIERDADAARTTAGVQRALGRLPAEQAALIETFHFERRPAADIARDTGLSERAVEGRLRRARHRLRREIESILRINGGPR